MMLISVVLFAFCFFTALGQRTCPPGEDQCPFSGPYNTVSISTDDNNRYVKTTTCPPYDNPRWTNPAAACIREQQTFTLPLVPTVAQKPIPVGEPYGRFEDILYLKEDPPPIFGAMGVLTSGVMVFGVGSPCGYSSKCPEDGAPTKYVDAVESEGHTVDQCGGHAAPTHDYHIHSSVGINSSTSQVQCKVSPDVAGQHSPLFGWMFDGFGLYGRYSLNGTVPTDLDSCGGHTHIINGTSVYHYHMPDGFPWTIGCFKGCPVAANNRREFADLSKYGCPS
jgi:hypothetical protein